MSGKLQHGLSCDPVLGAVYRVWLGIKARCLNTEHPAFSDYGGRGIVICDRWRDDVHTFIADVGPKPTPKHEIDRIDNDRGYEPGNVRWATRSENDRNRRSTTWIDFRGERRRLIDLCEEFGIPGDTARFRLRKMGMTSEEVFTTPVRPKSPNGQHRPRPEARTHQWGEANNCAKLTDDQRREVYRRFLAGECKSDLARAFGLDPKSIAKIVRNPRWGSPC
jgi:hypothetical protein